MVVNQFLMSVLQRQETISVASAVLKLIDQKIKMELARAGSSTCTPEDSERTSGTNMPVKHGFHLLAWLCQFKSGTVKGTEQGRIQHRSLP